MKKTRIVLMAVLFAAMLVVFYKKRIVLYEDITLNVQEAQDTPALKPGDRLEQDILIPYDSLEKISVAFSFPEEIPQDAEVLVEVTGDGGETLMSQALCVYACPNKGFVDFLVDLDHCMGKTVTISVANITPETVHGGEFSLLSTDKEILFLDTVSACRINGRETDSSIFCRAVCVKGYSFYESATWAFVVFLAGWVVIDCLTVRPGKRYHNVRSAGSR